MWRRGDLVSAVSATGQLLNPVFTETTTWEGVLGLSLWPRRMGAECTGLGGVLAGTVLQPPSLLRKRWQLGPRVSPRSELLLCSSVSPGAVPETLIPPGRSVSRCRRCLLQSPEGLCWGKLYTRCAASALAFRRSHLGARSPSHCLQLRIPTCWLLLLFPALTARDGQAAWRKLLIDNCQGGAPCRTGGARGTGWE